MIIYYLYKKTHRKTGLQYLGQTKKNPFAYEGSGVDWTTHIAQHGYDVDTEILLETTDKEKMKKVGRYYSNLWNIVEDPTWANRIPETGGGPGGITGRNRGEEFSKKCVINNTGKNNPSYGVYWWTNGTSEIKSKIFRCQIGTYNFLFVVTDLSSPDNDSDYEVFIHTEVDSKGSCYIETDDGTVYEKIIEAIKDEDIGWEVDEEVKDSIYDTLNEKYEFFRTFHINVVEIDFVNF